MGLLQLNVHQKFDIAGYFIVLKQVSHEIVNPFIASVESSNRSMNMFVEHLNVRIVGSHEDVKIGKIATESGRYGPIIDNCFVRDELENQGTYADAIDGVG